VKDSKINEFKVKDFASEIINKPRDMLNKKNIPQEILTTSWMFYILAVVLLAGGIIAVFIAPSFSGIIYNPSTGRTEFLFGFLRDYFLFVGIFSILLAPLAFLTGRGLKKGKKWAKIIAVTFSLLTIISSLFLLIQGEFKSLFTLVIGGCIIYLLSQKKTREFFHNK
jgi:hypothetical protein